MIGLVASHVDNLIDYIQSSVIKMYHFLTPCTIECEAIYRGFMSKNQVNGVIIRDVLEVKNAKAGAENESSNGCS